MKPADALSRIRVVDDIDADSLQDKSVIILGDGNVGGQLATHLPLAGLGYLTIVDKDTVGPENLASPAFGPGDIGKRKVDATANWVAEHAPWTRVDPVHADLRVDLPESIFALHDAVIAVTDSWSSRGHINRWAHRLPGRVRAVINGGLVDGLSWDVTTSEPGSGTGCIQCLHGEEMLNADEEGGCGLLAPVGERRPNPSTGFSGAAVAAIMAAEAVSALAGSGPRFAGKMLSFDHRTASVGVFRIVPDDGCSGHRPLVDGVDAVFLPMSDYTLEEIVASVAERRGVRESDVTLSSERELVLGMTCGACGHDADVWRPLLTIREQGGVNCTRCGSPAAELQTDTALPRDGRRLPDIGFPVGKALLAYVRGCKFEVVQLEEEVFNEQAHRSDS